MQTIQIQFRSKRRMAQSYDRTTSSSNIGNNSTIVGFFANTSEAYQAISELRQAGFTSDQIGLAVRGEDSSLSSASTNQAAGSAGYEDGDNRSFWQEVKDFFSGSDESESREFRSSLSGMDFDEDRANYYHQGLGTGGALVSVRADAGRDIEARRILEHNNADLRETGFTPPSSAGRDRANVVSDNAADRDFRVQLRGEMLQAHKERVQRGEVRLRKEVVTEQRSIEVPVTREELVIERVDASGATPTGEIGTDQDIRIPLSEERVSVEKTPVVTGEVRVGKKQVQDTRTVTGDVRREEVRVEKEGDVEVDEDALRRNKKDRKIA
jgi:uncharacterized protein (TIGR02271 family)